MGTDRQIDRFLTKFTGKMLQMRLKTHQIITKADFCVFCDHVEIFKLLIFQLIYKCIAYNNHYVKWSLYEKLIIYVYLRLKYI